MLHGAFKTGAKKTSWKISKIMMALFVMLHDTPARRDDYRDVTGSDKFPLQFGKVRWFDDGPVTYRAIEIWEHVKKIYAMWKSLPKSKQPSSQRFVTIQEAIKEEMFHFFASIADLLKPFLTLYQTLNPMLPFLSPDLHTLCREIMSWYIKCAVLSEASSGFKLCMVDVTAKENHLKLKAIHIGFGANKFIEDRLRIDSITSKKFRCFKEECVLFLSEMMFKIFERSPLSSSVARNSSSLSPMLMTHQPELCKSRFQNLLSNLLDLKRVTAKECENTRMEYGNYFKDVVILNLSDFKSFNKSNTRLDDFFFKKMKIKITQNWFMLQN